MKIYIKIIFFIAGLAMAPTSKANPLQVGATVIRHQDRDRIDSLPDNDPLILQLKAIDLLPYADHPADSFIAHLPPGIISYRIGSSSLTKSANVLFVNYDHSVFAMIFIKSWSYMDPRLVNTATPEQNWDVSLCRREKIAYIILYNGSECINGCEKELRYSLLNLQR